MYYVEVMTGKRIGPFDRRDTAELASILLPMGRVIKEGEGSNEHCRTN